MSKLSPRAFPVSRLLAIASRLLFALACAALLFCFAENVACFEAISPALAETKKKTESHKEEKKTGPRKRVVRKKKPTPTETPKEVDLKAEHSEFAHGANADASHQSFDSDLLKSKSLDAVLLIDASRSMQATDPTRLRDQAAKLFARFLGEGDRIAILQFDKEVKKLLDFVPINSETVQEIDKAVTGMPAEGNWTDLELPVREAVSLLTSEGRHDAERVVVLLSDGVLDPPPSRGKVEDIRKTLFDETLKSVKTARAKLYTMALSPQADKQLLDEMAVETGGLGWSAPNVSTIHLKFSELFLALKQPQTVEAEGGAFEIDANVSEATFFFNRKEAEQLVELRTPDGKTMSMVDFPPGVKWYHGPLFDVVTITRPLAGGWSIEGVENPEGFASLLTDLKLQVKWPENSLPIGAKVVFFARLTSKGELLNQPDLRDITFYRYKIINTESGNTVASGLLNDEAKDGDEHAADNIFAASVKLEESGAYKILVGVTTPTFTRQQQIPFEVSGSLVTLSLQHGDEFLNTKDQIRAEISEKALELKELKVQLLVQKDEEEKGLAIPLTATSDSTRKFLLPVDKLPSGNLKIVARVSGVGPEKKTVKEESATLEYVSAGTGEAEGEAIEETDEEGETSYEWVLGLFCLLLSAGWAGGAIWFVTKKLDIGKNLPQRENPYERPQALAEKIESLKNGASKQRRSPNPDDLITFEVVKEVFGNLPPGESAGQGEGDS
jgi:uncharacterized protein (TIGR03503 family)